MSGDFEIWKYSLEMYDFSVTVIDRLYMWVLLTFYDRFWCLYMLYVLWDLEIHVYALFSVISHPYTCNYTDQLPSLPLPFYFLPNSWTNFSQTSQKATPFASFSMSFKLRAMQILILGETVIGYNENMVGYCSYYWPVIWKRLQKSVRFVKKKPITFGCQRGAKIVVKVHQTNKQ